MEFEKTSAMLSGFLFSALAFQNLNSNGDAEGFLLGELSGEVNTSIPDCPLSAVQVIRTINIQRYIPCHQLFSFYNSSGEVNEQALKKIIPCYEKNVIGWYKFRRNSDQMMTFREKILHQNLQQHLSNERLVFLLLTSSLATENGSTHVLDHALHRFHNGIFLKVPLVVTNLGMSELQGYKTVSGTCRSPAFGRATHAHGSEFFNEDGTVKEAHKISEFYITVQDELKEVCIQAFNSEQVVRKFIEDIKSLKEELATKKRSKAVVSGRSDDPEAGENVLLCQALRTFFPNQEFLHSCVVCSKGKQIAKKVCNTEHNLKEVPELTLMVESSDFPEDDRTEDTIMHEFLDMENQRPSENPSFQFQNECLQSNDDSSDEEVLTSFEETDEDADNGDDDIVIEYSNSPTF
ncbi:BRCA1-A complex subunit Abraxas 1-like isoform X2 [Macrotis lagotis]|uniref:BRCA1-A complex subunit Abraxas 1-like isoform X2 n=1 Tax=Macrotis lagotis TaxID=92651 RepID=UPI003D69529C